ncbi:MAG: UPF0175 family protein [Archaeoglobaceae archaeon]
MISARIAKDLEKDIQEFVAEEGLERSVAVRKLLSIAVKEWKKEKAVKKLGEGKISFLKAAEIADMNPWDFAELIKDRKITWIKDERVLKDLEFEFE